MVQGPVITGMESKILCSGGVPHHIFARGRPSGIHFQPSFATVLAGVFVCT